MPVHALNNTLTKIAAAAELADAMTCEPRVRAELARILDLVDEAAAIVRSGFGIDPIAPAPRGRS